MLYMYRVSEKPPSSFKYPYGKTVFHFWGTGICILNQLHTELYSHVLSTYTIVQYGLHQLM